MAHKIVVTEGVEAEKDTNAAVSSSPGSKRHKIVKATSLQNIPFQYVPTKPSNWFTQTGANRDSNS